MLATTGLLKGKQISASPISYTLKNSLDVLFCGSFERIFKFNAFKCSVSYENIDFVEGDGFEVNTVKIWEKPCRMSFISFISPVCKRVCKVPSPLTSSFYKH